MDGQVLSRWENVGMFHMEEPKGNKVEESPSSEGPLSWVKMKNTLGSVFQMVCKGTEMFYDEVKTVLG